MANYTVPAGVSSYGNTSTAATSDTVTFADRYDFVSVTNLGTGPLYVNTNGGTVSDSPAENGSAVVAPGGTGVFSNALATWYQSSKVIPQGAIQVGNGAAYNASTNPSTQFNPGNVTPMGSLAGQAANPGTVVSVLSSAGGAYVISGAG